MQVNTLLQESLSGIRAENILISFSRTMLTTNLLFKYRSSYDPACIPVCLQIRVEVYLQTVTSASYFLKKCFEIFFQWFENTQSINFINQLMSKAYPNVTQGIIVLYRPVLSHTVWIQTIILMILLKKNTYLYIFNINHNFTWRQLEICSLLFLFLHFLLC